MNKQFDYILAELNILADSDLNLRNRIDSLLTFYLTALSALVSTAVIATAAIRLIELLGLVIGLAMLSLSVLGFSVSLRLLHLRIRRLEGKARLYGLRRILVNQGIAAAAYLSLERPKGDLPLIRENTFSLPVYIFSSSAIGISICAFFWGIEQYISIGVVVVSVTTGTLMMFALIAIQDRYRQRIRSTITQLTETSGKFAVAFSKSERVEDSNAEVE